MDLDSVFAPGGILEKELPFYIYRESQYEMALLVQRAFSEEKIAVLEAGTGIGKSFAYLVPSFLEILKDKKKRIVIATSTITLENQLFEKDIPLINKALGTDIESAILFGRSNYVCLDAFKEKEEELAVLKEDDSSDFAKLSAWVYSTESGALSDLKDKGAISVFHEIASDAATCKGAKCPYFGQCFFYEARKKAKRARIIVTNHHLFILDGKNRLERDMDYEEDLVLPSFDYAILDEAHHLESEAGKLLSLSYSYESLRKTIDNLSKKDKDLGGKSKIEYMRMYEQRKGASSAFSKELKVIKDEADSFDQRLMYYLSSISRDAEILLDDSLARQMEALRSQSEELGRRITNAVLSFTSILSDDGMEGDATFTLVLRNVGTLLSHASVLSSFFSDCGYEKNVPYFVRERSGRYSMLITPMNIGSLLSDMFYQKIKSMVFSSATLTVGRDFSHFESRTGLDSVDVISQRFDSPFNFKNNLMLLIPQDGMLYRKGEDEAYYVYAASAINEAINMSGGGALVLFTSNEMLNAVTEMVRSSLPDMTILKQDGRRANRKKLLDKFKEDKNSSLFATSSFWEGIDAPGETLRLLIIVKLPFSSPTSPMNKALECVLRRESRSSFFEISLPDAVIKFKQGVGRLIRSESDKGVVLVLDGRLWRNSYRRFFIESIPPCYLPEDCMMSNISEKIESFLY